jgi:DNA-binding transcriptional LysR family regulator
MDRTTSMATFVRVVDAGGFASAGRALGMSPSTVTEHVHALEERLGVRLLNRSTRRISLTEVGGAYYERSKQILADLDDADSVAHALHSSPRGTLRLNTSVAIPPFLAPVIAEYGDLHPDVSVNLSMTECMVDMVGEGFDLAVRDSPARPSDRLTSSSIIAWAVPIPLGAMNGVSSDRTASNRSR